MSFMLLKNSLGSYDLYVNRFHMPNFSFQRDYHKLQEVYVEIWEFDKMSNNNNNNNNNNNEEFNKNKEENVKLLEAISKIIRGESNDN